MIATRELGLRRSRRQPVENIRRTAKAPVPAIRAATKDPAAHWSAHILTSNGLLIGSKFQGRERPGRLWMYPGFLSDLRPAKRGDHVPNRTAGETSVLTPLYASAARIIHAKL